MINVTRNNSGRWAYKGCGWLIKSATSKFQQINVYVVRRAHLRCRRQAWLRSTSAWPLRMRKSLLHALENIETEESSSCALPLRSRNARWMRVTVRRIDSWQGCRQLALSIPWRMWWLWHSAGEVVIANMLILIPWRMYPASLCSFEQSSRFIFLIALTPLLPIARFVAGLFRNTVNSAW